MAKMIAIRRTFDLGAQEPADLSRTAPSPSSRDLPRAAPGASSRQRPLGGRSPSPGRRGRSLTALLVLATALVGVGSDRPAGAQLLPRANGDIAYVDSGQIWIGDPYGQRRTRVVAGPAGARRPAAPSWSHAGTQLAFISDYSPWVMNPDGSNAHQLPVGGQVRSVPSWYPDDRRILVAASSFPGQGVLVWLAVDGTGSGTIPVPAGLDPVSPSVSPDGMKAVFAAGYVDESLKGIYVMNLDGSGFRRLTGGFGTDVEPSWSPDGRTIAFTNLYPSPPTVGTARTILVNPDGTGGRLLRHGSISGSWSPDGRFLLVGDPSSGRVLAVRADGSGETALGGCDPLRVSGVSWRPAPAPEARTARTWGWNGVGQLGNGTTVDSRTPAPAGLSGVISVAAGYYHSLALRDDGSVWAWGWNAVGQLGNGTTADSAAPVRVVGLTGITCLAAGAFHSLAVRVDGTVFTWGWNPFGQLGDGSTSDRSLPRVVPGLAADSVAGGIAHSLALSSDGTVWTWGWNGLGQLGSSSARDSAVPIPVIRRSAGRATVTAIAAGGHHSLAATENGVLAWGWNQFGQVGEGSTANWSFPVAVQGLYGEITRVAAGGYHSLALRDDGSVFAWGSNVVGQLGDGTTADSLRPKQVPFAGPASALTAGLLHSLALRDRSLLTWGWNALGQLGDGSTTDRHAPTPVLAGVNSVGGGALHSLAS